MLTFPKFRFGLKFALVGVTLVCALNAYFGERARRSRRLASDLMEAGALISYQVAADHSRESGYEFFIPGYRTPWQKKLSIDIRRTWPEGFSYIWSVRLPPGQLTPEVRRSLTQLPHLRNLTVNGTDFCDADLCSLSCSNSLEWLECRDTSLTDKGLLAISQFHKLQTLDVVNTSVTDDGLKHLAPLKKLEMLRLGSSGKNRPKNSHLITEIGVGHVRKNIPDCTIAGSWRSQ